MLHVITGFCLLFIFVVSIFVNFYQSVNFCCIVCILCTTEIKFPALNIFFSMYSLSHHFIFFNLFCLHVFTLSVSRIDQDMKKICNCSLMYTVKIMCALRIDAVFVYLYARVRKGNGS